MGLRLRTSFHSRFMTSGGEGGTLAEESHSNLAVYRNDIDISIAWGMDMDWAGVNDPIKRNYEFTQDFFDTSGHPQFADVFYRGALVDREILVTVDNANALLPLPRAMWGETDDPTKPNRIGESVTQWQFDFGHLVHSFELSSSDYHRAISIAGIVVDHDR